MLVGVKLTVNISRDQSCFAYINSKYENANSPNETNCIQVQVGENHVYLWTVFRSSVPEGWILVNPVLCMLLGMTLGTDVYVNTSSNIRKLDSLYIEADGKEDQLILELNHTSLQSVILDQVRLVVAHQKAVIWLSRSMPIVFTPLQTGILVNHTQVIVRSIAIKSPQRLSVNPKVEEQMKNTYNAMKGLLRPLFRLPKRMALRALPIGDGKKDLLHPYTVFMHEELVEEKFRSSPLILALMNNMPTLIENKEEGEMFWRHEICVEVVPVNSVVFRSLCREVYSQHIPTVLIPKSLNNIIHANNGAMVMLTFIDSKTLNQPQHIEITTYTAELKKESEQSLIEKFKSLVVQNTYSGKAFVINHDMIKQNKLLTTGFIKFRLSPAGLIYTTLTQETFRLCSISAKMLNISDLRPQYPVVQLDYDYKNYCRTIKPLELLLERVMSHIYFDIHREAKFYKCSDLKSGVLITGLNGTGKSTICNLVEKEISVYTYILQCRAVKGRKDINTILSRALYICRGRKPSLMILDDLDDLVPASMEGLSPQDIASYNTLALDIKHKIGMAAGVSLLITARSVNSLHPIFRMFTGQPMFTAQFNMPELAQEDRVQLFQHLLNPKVREQFEVDVDDAIRLAMETNGSNIMQMLDYFKKKIYIAIKKKCAYRDAPKPRIVEDVTKDVARVKQFDVWGPIGGLERVKEKLNECIFWPILYPALFPSQSCGILLYGPPGTGKSLIGSCLAKMSNMNMITVKGPELLSKYIGQSEAAVREVFDKADMKRPCILFFDEFDSLAPRRGHDSTGVTDRVVNQLLARLDGAEGGARGPVLAATSRPDLLDPALLRQGRLSTHLYTEMPGLDGRYEVLRNLSRDFNVNPGVDLQAVAEQTEGYSPADLRALLVAAQLSRLDLELLRVRVTDDDDEPTQGTVVIDTDDINNALAETKPSLNAQQRKFFEFVYRRFRGERPAGDDMPSRDRSGMRVTLA